MPRLRPDVSTLLEEEPLRIRVSVEGRQRQDGRAARCPRARDRRGTAAVLSDDDTDRWYTRLKINDRSVRFLLDCGATVNLLLAEAFVRSIGRIGDVRPSTATLRMFDKSKLQTSGVITLSVHQPHTLSTHELQLHVATKHDQPLLGFHACRALQLLRVVAENICEVQAAPAASATSSTSCVAERDVLAEYTDLFDGVGLLEGDVHLETDPTVPHL